jgi:hypothetical protein
MIATVILPWWHTFKLDYMSDLVGLMVMVMTMMMVSFILPSHDVIHSS